MTETEYSKVVAKNLKRLAYESGKNQIEIARDLGINQATLSSWMTGTRTPKMPNVDKLCKYFNCSRADIIGTTEEYQNGGHKPTAQDFELLNAYHSASDEIKNGILTILGLKR